MSVCCQSVNRWSIFQIWCNHISVYTMSWFLMNKKKEGEKRSTEIKRQFLRAVSISIDYNHYARCEIWKIRFHSQRTKITTLIAVDSGEQGVWWKAEQRPVAECFHRGKDSQFFVSHDKRKSDTKATPWFGYNIVFFNIDGRNIKISFFFIFFHFLDFAWIFELIATFIFLRHFYYSRESFQFCL